ncbi:MAG: aminotransferase class III-fold pyridoxal phosphate-dependent enzyme [Actinobacteria bacterium]|nr:aminotransferase class III-fold pyridoxal phosphate-dependent enzyme [Actinomycetota bacterium]
MFAAVTAGWRGAAGALGVEPDLVALAKSIGGGLPLGAFGGKREYMDEITNRRVVHLGTYNGNPLCMAAARAVLAEVCTPEATDDVIARNHRLVEACEPIRNYRDYKATDFDLAFAQWMHGINRGILLPPGLDEQWLISVMHDDEAAMTYAGVFADFVEELVR